ncbi:flagellar motor switch protein FliN/FliY [Micromonospora pattaloongensis]|uniref:Flagellar motor switch protein FliN/FliY n=1 Tax=Micromonospora pattaloongensis TaxID=405436 RepID=A0A1H3MZU0_9ACTN|nr:flagellar motor switch protein FliN [Micromonospora pattaloongensis]SDY81509.1 flagellar motor switch protein FliN/FliY [Micromonospora pattaloongensis]
MTSPTLADAQLDLVRAAARAALAVLPTSEALQADEPRGDTPQPLPRGQAVTARFTGSATGEVVVVVGQDLADALRESPLGELDLTTAVRPALEAAAGTFGPVVLDPGLAMEPSVALSALTAKGNAVLVPLTDGAEIRALVALRLEPWPGEPSAPAPAGWSPAPTPPKAASAPRGGLELLHDVEMEVSAELGRTRMSVRELLSLTPGAIIELDRGAGTPADLLVNGRLIARGEVVVIDENFGLRITELVAPGNEHA